jgi:hypothetical protein
VRRVLVGALLILTAVAGAQDDKPRTPLPVNGFAKARAGDWAVLVGSDQVLRYRVESGGGEDVTAIVEAGAPGADPARFLFGYGAKSGPTLEQAFSWLRLGSLAAPKLEGEEERKVGDHPFACKRLAFDGKKGEQAVHVVAWISSEVRAGGLVALEVKGGRSATFELAGFGGGERAEWGRTLEQVRSDWAKDHPGK